MEILVETILKCAPDCDNEIVENTKIIDYFDSSDAKWLRNHCVWAFTNNRKVQLSNTID